MTSSEPSTFRLMKVIFFLTILIPSLLLCLYIIIQFIRSSQVRQRVSNQSIFLLIIIAFLDLTIDLPITIEYLRHGILEIRKDNFCLFWIWCNFSLQSTNLFLMTWTSIQRHILIFHSHSLQTRRGLYQWHYIPYTFVLIYLPSFYFTTIFVIQCENSFDYRSYLCGMICYNNIVWLSTYDWVVHMLIPSLIIPLLSLTLLIRVLYQMKKMKRTTKWKFIRKVTLQLIIISLLYLFFWFPLALISLIRIYFNPNFLTEFTLYYFNYTPYFVQLLIPYFSFACLPEIWPKSNRIAPLDIVTLRNGLH